MTEISKNTKAIIKRKRAYVTRRRKKKYQRELIVGGGYDILEYWAVIRRFLQWKYEISYENLELLFYLYPRGYFTRKDFDYFPVRWGRDRLLKMIEVGFFEEVFPERTVSHVYRLSKLSQSIVQKAHKLLSGEIRLPISAEFNPAFKQTATYSQKKYRNVMIDMREAMEEKFKG